VPKIEMDMWYWNGHLWEGRRLGQWTQLSKLQLLPGDLNRVRWMLLQELGDLPARVLSEFEQQSLRERDAIMRSF
jgi:hypothetical protein